MANTRARWWAAIVGIAAALLAAWLLLAPRPEPAPAPEAPRLTITAPQSRPAPASLPYAAPPVPVAESPPESPTPVNMFKLYADLKRRKHLIGVVVPDDFVLPPGYMRHYQTAHGPDGLQTLAPILIYNDAAPPRDEAGNPLPLPADRVVPSDRLPPGLPVKLLEIPPSEFEGDE